MVLFVGLVFVGFIILVVGGDGFVDELMKVGFVVMCFVDDCLVVVV